MKLVVLVLAYNEEETIHGVVQATNKKLSQLHDFKTEIVVVDDGSTDKTVEQATKAGAHVVSHMVNQGVGRAFQTGLEAAIERQADILVNIDADGQFNPQEIDLLIDPILSNGQDFVCGDRFSKQDNRKVRPEYMSQVKYYGNQLMTQLINRLTNASFTDVSCGYRAYSRKALLMLNLTGAFSYTQESFIDLAFKRLSIVNVPVTVEYFPERTSKVASSIPKYALNTLKIILRTFRDYKPLQFFWVLSIPPLILGVIGIIFTSIHYLISGLFSPYISVAFIAIYLFTLGLIFIITGVVADMFVRVRLNQEKILYYQKRQV